MISKYASVEQIDDDLYAIFNRLVVKDMLKKL